MKMFFRCTFAVLLFHCLFEISGCGGSEQAAVDRSYTIADASRTTPPVPARYEKVVTASPRRIPVAYDVDVLVVGGTSGGVAAAVQAAEDGASVFLASMEPYLGSDICGTYRLWLEADEVPASPLAKKVFAEPAAAELMRNAIAFTYEADRPSAAPHKDTPTPSLLKDRKWHSAGTQSVQYDGDVTITADLAAVRNVKNVRVMVYQRRNPNLSDDFEVAGVTVSLSDDKDRWKDVATVKNERAGESLNQPWGPIELSAPVEAETRYVRFLVKKSERPSRPRRGTSDSWSRRARM